LSDGTLVDFMVSDLAYQRRQDLPPVYAMNGAIYLNQYESLVRDHTFLPEGTCAYIMPAQRSLDIDTPWEFHLAELILKDQHEHA
jgi:CMP-N-acetylneuraminic acid synthetase